MNQLPSAFIDASKRPGKQPVILVEIETTGGTTFTMSSYGDWHTNYVDWFPPGYTTFEDVTLNWDGTIVPPHGSVIKDRAFNDPNIVWGIHTSGTTFCDTAPPVLTFTRGILGINRNLTVSKIVVKACPAIVHANKLMIPQSVSPVAVCVPKEPLFRHIIHKGSGANFNDATQLSISSHHKGVTTQCTMSKIAYRASDGQMVVLPNNGEYRDFGAGHTYLGVWIVYKYPMTEFVHTFDNLQLFAGDLLDFSYLQCQRNFGKTGYLTAVDAYSNCISRYTEVEEYNYAGTTHFANSG